MNKPEHTPGRPHLDGSRPGQGEPTVTKCISIPLSLGAYLKRVGGGNLSKGVRTVARYYQEQENNHDEIR
jgi:hypothetical protein